jgi:hypothetical protein
VNGISGGLQRIMSGSVTLNGQLVISTSQFNQSVDVTTTPVQLLSQNTLQINTTGLVGSTAIVLVQGQPSSDVNGDGVVNCADIAIVKRAFGKTQGQAGFDPRADVNADSVINIKDLAIVSAQLPKGTTCP